MSEEKKTDHFLSKCPVREKRSPLAYQGSRFIVMLEFTLYFSFFLLKNHIRELIGGLSGSRHELERFYHLQSHIYLFRCTKQCVILDNFSAVGSLK